MSGRIRTIKPELLEDAVTAGLSDTAHRIFVAMILLSDDHGCFRAEPELLRGQIFWRARPLVEFDTAIIEVRALVEFYAVRGQRYAHIRNWEKHQRVDRPSAPRVPGPDKADQSLAGPSRDPRESLASLSCAPPEGPPRVPEVQPEAQRANDQAEALPVGSSAHESPVKLEETPANDVPRETLASVSRLISDLRSPISDLRSPTMKVPSAAQTGPTALELEDAAEIGTATGSPPASGPRLATRTLSPTRAAGPLSLTLGSRSDDRGVSWRVGPDGSDKPGLRRAVATRDGDLEIEKLTADELAVHEAIAADEHLVPIVRRPRRLARDLLAEGPGIDVARAVGNAGRWLRANPARKKSNGNKFLLNWVKRDQEKRRESGTFPMASGDGLVRNPAHSPIRIE